MDILEEDERLIESLVSNKEAFNAYVYTSLVDAVDQLKERSKNPDLNLDAIAPEEMLQKPRAVLFRQIFTSNYESRRFLNLVEASELEPLFCEYYADKFTSNNDYKHSLGRMFFFKGIGKNGGSQIHSRTVLDFNTANGKKINDLKTLWGESLIDFHHGLFKSCFMDLPKEDFFDASAWFKAHGESADKYYELFLTLFVQHAILFEDFMLNEKELSFTKDIFLPAFISVRRKTGKKPLIVSLEPTQIEDARFWLCHPFDNLEIVDKKLELVKSKVE